VTLFRRIDVLRKRGENIGGDRSQSTPILFSSMVNALLALHRQEEVIVSIKRFELID
jgi:hypothetical protein